MKELIFTTVQIVLGFLALGCWLLSTAQQRQLWAPVCKPNERAGVLEAWKALDACLKLFNYAPRKGVTGARSCRRITGGTGYSLHAFYVDGMFTFWNGLVIGLGIAVDINWDKNPYGARLVTDMPREMVEAILAIRTNNGREVWGWGGNYSRNKDAMHYELGCSPADISTGINWATVRGAPVPPGPTPPLGKRSWPVGAEKLPTGGYSKVSMAGKGKDSNVLWFQRVIKERTNYAGPMKPDALYGQLTHEAVWDFQGAVGFKQDGVVGPKTWAKLNEFA